MLVFQSEVLLESPDKAVHAQGDDFFVNQRPVDNRTLTYATLEAFHTFIPKEDFLRHSFFEIDPIRVDVNVHPAKKR